MMYSNICFTFANVECIHIIHICSVLVNIN